GETDLALGAPGPLPGEFGVAADLDPPSLVIAQVEVEHIEFVQGQEIDEAQDLAFGLEVSGDVEHGTTPAKTWGVGDGEGGQHPRGVAEGRLAVGIGGQELAQGLGTVEHPRRVVADDERALVVDDQPVTLGAEPGMGVDAQPDPGVVLGTGGEGESGGRTEFATQPGQRVLGAGGGGDAGPGSEGEAFSVALGEFLWTGDQSDRHGQLLLSGLDQYPTWCHV